MMFGDITVSFFVEYAKGNIINRRTRQPRVQEWEIKQLHDQGS